MYGNIVIAILLLLTQCTFSKPAAVDNESLVIPMQLIDKLPTLSFNYLKLLFTIVNP